MRVRIPARDRQGSSARDFSSSVKTKEDGRLSGEDETGKASSSESGNVRVYRKFLEDISAQNVSSGSPRMSQITLIVTYNVFFFKGRGKRY